MDTTRLQAALDRQVAAGAPGTLARLEAADQAWTGAAGALGREPAPPLRTDSAFRIASVTKTVTAVVALGLSRDDRLDLDAPLRSVLGDLLDRWPGLASLRATTTRQLLTHTAGLPDYFHDESFLAAVGAKPSRRWDPAELIDQVDGQGALFAPEEGFAYSDTGYVLAGLVLERAGGGALHELYRRHVFDPLGMDATWLEGSEAPRRAEVARHYDGVRDLSLVSPTIDWAGGGLVSTTADLAAFVRGLWSGRLAGAGAVRELTRWTPGARFPPGHAVRYDDYGLGIGRLRLEGTELVGHTGYYGAFAFHAPERDAILVGTHNDARVSRWPLVGALCDALG